MKHLLIVILMAIPLVAQEIPGIRSITHSNLMKTVEYLASKELAGRLSGSEGYNKAAEFMSGEFRKLKLKPANGNSYFQKLKVEYNEILPPVRLNLIKENGDTKYYKLGKDYVFRGFTGGNHITAPVVFCGYGVSQPEIGYDDYENIDVKGKIVMVFKYNPAWKINDSVNWGDGSLRTKIHAAVKHSAIGIIFISFPNDAKPQKTLLSILEGEGRQYENFPSLHIDLPGANDFVEGSEYTLKELQTNIDSLKSPFSVALKTKAEIEVHAKYYKEKETMNVAGILEGNDPILKNEYVIIGAHLDHVGSQAGGEIYAPGANDNASGSAAVLEIARTFINNKIVPKRSILFVLFASEELGLNGSKYFADNPPVPLKDITAMLNMDCVGYGDSIQIGNGKSSPQLWNMIKVQDSLFTKMSVNNTWNGGGADASPFHNKGIPCAYFVTTNSYEHLHYITDTPETLNRNLYEKITQLAYISAFRISHGEYLREKVIK